MPQQDLLQRLVQLFLHPVFRVRRAALGTVMEVIRYDAQQTNMLMELGLVRALAELLKTPDNKLRIDVCELLIVLSLKGTSRLYSLPLFFFFPLLTFIFSRFCRRHHAH